MSEAVSKVHEQHLRREAYLYVRQSTVRQVFENTESTKRQYGLKQRALALGWRADQVHVIDSDLGQSGSSAQDREGFQKLVAEVSMGHVGIVLGLEVSRLARNCSDWHRLLELCALTDTLILDEDGLYDPTQFNDRLLLGLKGTMSEAELHVLTARLRGGILNKARRGELRIRLPAGYVYSPDNRIRMDPDQEVQGAIRTFFAMFRRTGSACAVVKAFRKEGLRIPSQVPNGPRKGQMLWRPLRHSRALNLLHNPCYAGAYVFGSTRQRKLGDGHVKTRHLSQEEWTVCIPGAHEGYITWEEFERNRSRLKENARANGADRRRSPPREGPALLQGLAVCGRCGRRMTVRYYTRSGRSIPMYVCQRAGIETAQRICQSIPGQGIDVAIGKLLVERLTPDAVELSLAVQDEIRSRTEEVDRLRRKHVDHARYEAELAERRYRLVDPANRLVAGSLETEWNERLRDLAQAQEEYEQRRATDTLEPNAGQRSELLALSANFAAVWQDEHTPDRERKRMLRLMMDDVTLVKNDDISAQVRFKGGATESMRLPIPLQSWKRWTTKPAVVAELDRLLDRYPEVEAAEQMNKQGLESGFGLPFSATIVRRLVRDYSLRSHFQRLRDRGLLTPEEVAAMLKIKVATVNKWRSQGRLVGHAYNKRNWCLYDPPVLEPGIAMQASSSAVSDHETQRAKEV